jgi:ubiquinone/menaquinone biosynthesis C-methylase UbiE
MKNPIQLRRYYEREGEIQNHQELLFVKTSNVFLMHEQRYRLLETLKIVPQSRNLLDIGCGEGLMTNLFKADFKVGVDISANKIKRARKKKEIYYVVADAHHLPFKEKFFEISICTETLEHLASPEMVFKEMSGVTSKNIILSIPLISFIENTLLRMQDHSLGFDEIGKGHLRVYDKKSLKKELESLEHFKMEKIKCGCFGFHNLLRIVLKSLMSDNFCVKICTLFDKTLSRFFPFRSKHLILSLKSLNGSISTI